jgi:hypothetical protein
MPGKSIASCWISVALTDQLPKLMPPTSSWCAHEPAHATCRPPWKIGATIDTSG